MAPFEIIDILKEQGADISKTVMSHLDRTLTHNTEVLLKVKSKSSSSSSTYKARLIKRNRMNINKK